MPLSSRMLAILKSDKEKEAFDILKEWNINAVKIGKVTDDKIMRVKENGVVVCEIPAEALTKKAPLYTRETKELPPNSALHKIRINKGGNNDLQM